MRSPAEQQAEHGDAQQRQQGPASRTPALQLLLQMLDLGLNELQLTLQGFVVCAHRI